jgi:hypothetical protein
LIYIYIFTILHRFKYYLHHHIRFLYLIIEMSYAFSGYGIFLDGIEKTKLYPSFGGFGGCSRDGSRNRKDHDSINRNPRKTWSFGGKVMEVGKVVEFGEVGNPFSVAIPIKELIENCPVFPSSPSFNVEKPVVVEVAVSPSFSSVFSSSDTKGTERTEEEKKYYLSKSPIDRKDGWISTMATYSWGINEGRVYVAYDIKCTQLEINAIQFSAKQYAKTLHAENVERMKSIKAIAKQMKEKKGKKDHAKNRDLIEMALSVYMKNEKGN